MYPARAMYVFQDITYVFHGDRVVVGTTDPAALAELPLMLHRLAAVAQAHRLEEMTVILAADTLKAIGFPPNAPIRGTDTHPALQRARSYGWHVSKLSPWTTFDRQGIALHIGVMPWLSARTAALFAKNRDELIDDEGTIVYLAGRFQQLTGVAFRATPGVCGTAMIRRYWRGDQPMWHPKWSGCAPAESRETEKFLKWMAPGAATDPRPFRHSYDARRAYLAASVSGLFAATELRHTGRAQFDATVAGYWKVVVPHWNESRLPHPMGMNRRAGEEAWVTTPTLGLVWELALNYSAISPPEVIDSYTAPKPITRTGKRNANPTKRLLRSWAEKIDQLADAALCEPSPIEGRTLESVIKSMYKESAGGLWFNDTSHIHRPDWHHTVIATARSNHFRRIYKEAQIGLRWPTLINVDSVTYASECANWEDDAPAHEHFPVRPGLGGFKTPNTETVSLKGEVA